MSQIDAHYNKKELPEKLLRMGIILLIIGVVLGLVGFFVDPTRASFNYLIAYTFLISIAVGALFLIALEYATGAIWGVPFRRVKKS